jgi:hypothetical protein
MTWDAYHHRGDLLRAVIEAANDRRDGLLPLDLPGLTEAFADELELVAALQLRWHTRLTGNIERALMESPVDPESAVTTAWRRTARELVGVREILDARAARPANAEMAAALRRASEKDRVLMAAMAGRAGAGDPAAPLIGRELERRARVAYDPERPPVGHRASPRRPAGLLDRLKARIAA